MSFSHLTSRRRISAHHTHSPISNSSTKPQEPTGNQPKMDDQDPDPSHRRRTSTHKPPTALSTRHPSLTHAAASSSPQPLSAGTRRGRNRSSSLTSVKRSLSRILPSHRAEKGGTLRDGRGFADALGEEGGRSVDAEGARRARSWSPRKSEVSGLGDVDVGDERGGEEGREKGGNAFQRFLGLRKSSVPGTSKGDEMEGKLRKSSDKEKGKEATQATTPSQSQIPVRTAPTQDGRANTQFLSPEGWNSQQMYENKRARREQRRSYRSSEDFLAVAGANPRTGYWDPSVNVTSTSSSSDRSARVRQRGIDIEENRRKMEAAKKELEDALERREREMRERDVRRRESRIRRERKREEVRRKEMRSREGARWRSEGEGWSMVVEPGLSPITQSVAATPRRDVSPDDKLTGMRVPEEAGEQDYFGPSAARHVSLQRQYGPGMAPLPHTRLPATPTRLTRYPGGAQEPVPYGLLSRKPLPAPSRIVSGDMELYVTPPSPTKAEGTSPDFAADPMPGLQPPTGPPTGPGRINPEPASVFPIPRRREYQTPYVEPTPNSLQNMRGHIDPMERSDGSHMPGPNSPLASAPARKSPVRTGYDPFGPIPRRRPASPPKTNNLSQSAGFRTQPGADTPPLVGSIPIQKNETEPDPPGFRRLPHGVMPGTVEAERRRLENSSDTIVHRSFAETSPEVLPEALQLHPPSAPRTGVPDVALATPGSTMHPLNFPQINPEQSFLGITPDVHPRGEATATSSRSVSMSRALIHHRSLQSLKDTYQAKRIKDIASMGDLPPFILKDPMTGTSAPIAPSNPLIPEEATSSTLKQETVEVGEKEAPTITTPITTTTGCDPLRCLPEEAQGARHGSNTMRSSPQQPRPLSRIPTSPFPKSIRNNLPSGSPQRKTAGTAISLAGQAAVTPTKRRIPKWYQRVLPGPGRGAAMNTPTSTSTSPVKPTASGHSEAQTAARVALRNVSSTVNVSPGTSPGGPGQQRGVPRGSLDKGDSPRSRTLAGGNAPLLRRRVENAAMAGNPLMNRGEDRLVVWHSEPGAGRKRKRNDGDGGAQKKHVGFRATAPAMITKGKPAAKAEVKAQPQLPLVLIRTTKQMVLTAWWFVEPVFDPRSAFRGRWESQQLTWHDGVLIAGACLFGAGALVAAVLGMRLLGVVVQIVRVVGGTCRFLFGG